MARRARAARRDDGFAGPGWVVVCMGLLVVLGMLVDGGGLVRASDRADEIAHEAARTGGQMIDPAQAITGQAVVVDPDAAIAAAQAYLDAADVTGTVTVSPDGTELSVSVITTYSTIMLSALGYGTLTATGEGTAYLVHHAGD
ncbi:hypothetical protein ACFC1B_06825 [Streptomyces xiamenensis]|uniref:hypothetical protein n=1 Tax=Streptomyces xiamenensis TaxID=408015 RepID=UPI0035DBBF60